MIETGETDSEFLGIYFFLPSISHRSEYINEYFKNVLISPIDITHKQFNDWGGCDLNTATLDLFGADKTIMSGFAGNYFSSVCCSCADLNKDMICIHCKRLRYSLNNDTKKVSLKKEDLPEEFKLIEIDIYLKKIHKRRSVFFSFLRMKMKLNHHWIRMTGAIFSAEKNYVNVIFYFWDLKK